MKHQLPPLFSWSLLAALSVLVVTQSAHAAEPIAVVVYHGIGTTAGAWLSGRTLQDEGLAPAKKSESSGAKAWRLLQSLESDEVEGVQLEIAVAGVKVRVKSDDEGLFDVHMPGPLPVGTHPVKVVVEGHKRWRALPGSLAVFPARAATIVISDFDDTVVATNVTSKIKMIKGLLTSNFHDLKPFIGAPALYRQLRRKGWPLAFVSGSPINLHLRLERFLRANRFPVAPLLLKRLGTKQTDDALFAHEGYKIKQIERLMRLLPGYRLVLFGDSGERDPEVYRAIVKRYPGRVDGVFIHNVTASAATDPRFAGQRLFSDYRKLAKQYWPVAPASPAPAATAARKSSTKRVVTPRAGRNAR